MNKYAPIFIIVTLLGCAPPTPPKAAAPPAAPKKNDADNPLVKEARPDTEAVLSDLLAGKYDDDPSFAPVARKVNGFQSWSIETQEVDPGNPKMVNFGGTLDGPNGEATFTVGMVKQQNGKWMIGTFSGPNPK
jgi:hypothetical protein